MMIPLSKSFVLLLDVGRRLPQAIVIACGSRLPWATVPFFVLGSQRPLATRPALQVAAPPGFA